MRPEEVELDDHGARAGVEAWVSLRWSGNSDRDPCSTFSPCRPRRRLPVPTSRSGGGANVARVSSNRCRSPRPRAADDGLVLAAQVVGGERPSSKGYRRTRGSGPVTPWGRWSVVGCRHGKESRPSAEGQKLGGSLKGKRGAKHQKQAEQKQAGKGLGRQVVRRGRALAGAGDQLRRAATCGVRPRRGPSRHVGLRAGVPVGHEHVRGCRPARRARLRSSMTACRRRRCARRPPASRPAAPPPESAGR